MSENKINSGDVVRLKSGGPAMTVTGLRFEGGVCRAVCVWFVPSGHVGFQTWDTPPYTLTSDLEALELVEVVVTAKTEKKIPVVGVDCEEVFDMRAAKMLSEKLVEQENRPTPIGIISREV